MSGKPEVGKFLTKQEAGPPPSPGEAWDEASQQWLPRGTVALAERLERPLDLQKHMEAFERNRATVVRFIGQQLQESTYDTGGYPVAGKLNDYYVIPGAKTKALTKLGAEKLGQFFRFARGEPKIADKTETKEYVSATVSVSLVDHFGRIVGGHAASASTAEKGFQSWKARQKYGAVWKKENNEWVEKSPPDYRAALNDVVARAGKRAFVQAMIVATATDEIFHAAEEERDRARAGQEPTEGPTPAAELPFNTKTYPKGTKLSQIELEDLKKLKVWCADRQDQQQLLEAIDFELEERRARVEEGPPI